MEWMVLEGLGKSWNVVRQELWVMTFGRIFFRGWICEFAVFLGRFGLAKFGNLQLDSDRFILVRTDWFR